jgi:hypothetical protein
MRVTTFLTLFLSVFSLQGKDASKPAGNWFQLSMFLPAFKVVITYLDGILMMRCAIYRYFQHNKTETLILEY